MDGERRVGLIEPAPVVPEANGKHGHVADTKRADKIVLRERHAFWAFRVFAFGLALGAFIWAVVKIAGALEHVAGAIQLK